MRTELLEIIWCPRCRSSLRVEGKEPGANGLWEGELVCTACHALYRVEGGMPFLYVPGPQWASKAKEAEGWVALHKAKGIYDQTGCDIDFQLPYFPQEPWITVAKMFDIALDILRLDRRERVLDLGAGRGWAAKRFALLGCQAVAIDIVADDQVGLARSWALMREADVRYDMVIGDNEDLPFRSGLFDVVFSCGTLHHTSSLPLLMGNIYRVLKEGGRLIAINEPCIPLGQDEEEALLTASEEVAYGIAERRPNLVKYRQALQEVGFNNIEIFPWQVYHQTDFDLRYWAHQLGVAPRFSWRDLALPFKERALKAMGGGKSKLSSDYRRSVVEDILAKCGGALVIVARK